MQLIYGLRLMPKSPWFVIGANACQSNCVLVWRGRSSQQQEQAAGLCLRRACQVLDSSIFLRFHFQLKFWLDFINIWYLSCSWLETNWKSCNAKFIALKLFCLSSCWLVPSLLLFASCRKPGKMERSWGLIACACPVTSRISFLGLTRALVVYFKLFLVVAVWCKYFLVSFDLRPSSCHQLVELQIEARSAVLASHCERLLLRWTFWTSRCRRRTESLEWREDCEGGWRTALNSLK